MRAFGSPHILPPLLPAIVVDVSGLYGTALEEINLKMLLNQLGLGTYGIGLG